MLFFLTLNCNQLLQYHNLINILKMVHYLYIYLIHILMLLTHFTIYLAIKKGIKLFNN